MKTREVSFHNGNSVDWRITFDGIMTYLRDSEKGFALYYTHVFNNGILEAVDAFTLRIRNGEKIIPSISFEKKLVNAYNKYLKSFKKHQIDIPIWGCLSLLDVKGYTMGVNNFNWGEEIPIDREELIVPEIKIESYKQIADKILRPAFDSIWNACGYDKSRNYDENGNWNPKG